MKLYTTSSDSPVVIPPNISRCVHVHIVRASEQEIIGSLINNPFQFDSVQEHVADIVFGSLMQILI